MLVDDLEVCDSETLRFLTLLLDAVDQAPVAVVLAAGPTPDAGTQDRVALLASRATPLRLGALGPRAVQQMLVDELGDEPAADVVEACLAATDGNPFLVRELVGSLRTAVATGGDPASVLPTVVPDGVVRTTRARLSAAGEGAVRLARAVAVLGPGVGLGDAAAVSDLSVEAAGELAERLVAADLLVDDVALTLRHPLLAAAVLVDLGSIGRANLHRRAAQMLDARGAEASQVAHHLLGTPPAGDDRAVRTLRRAALEASASGDPERAVELLRRALAEPPGPGVRGALVLELARHEAAVGEPAAGARFAEALELTESPQERVVALRELSRHQFIGERHPEAAATIRRAMTEAGPDSPMAPDLLAEYIAAVTFGGPVVDAATRAEFDQRVLDLVQSHRTGTLPDNPALALQVASILAGVRGRRTDVVTLMEQVLGRDHLDELPPYGLAASWAVLTLLAVDAVDVALRVGEDAYTSALRSGSTLRLGNAVFSVAASSAAAGLLERAEPECVKSLHLARSGVTSTLVTSAALLATVRRGRGDLAGARRALAQVQDAEPEGLSYGLLLHHRSMLALTEGDCGAAWAESQQAREHLARFHLEDYPLAPWRLVAGLAGHAQGRRDAGRALLEEELALARLAGTPRSIGHALLCLARVADEAGRLPLLEEAVSVLAGSGDRLRRAEAHGELGLALAERGDPGARELLQQAYELARTCGATPLARRVSAGLRALGTRPRPVVVAGSPLTEVEERTAELARRGRSNREIAEELHLTTSTVEFHLTRIYRKLGVRSRRELIDRATDGTAE